MILKRTRLFSMSLLAVSSLTLASCGNSSEEGATGMTAAESAAAATSSASTATDTVVSLADGVIRASTEDNPMTAIFGELHNNSAEEITITGFIAAVEAGSYEIHETVNGTMQQKAGGITVPAGEDHELEPGGDHFMMMELASPVAAGEAVTLTLELSDGSTVELGEVPVRTIAAGDEDYGDIDDHGSHDMHDDADEETGNEH
ncbi:copper chaperone PCu(A)C [Corynebacterium sp. A21]|uniref:copper chaperone PCu(A)C n=1 Tax=Corynebacterium sp. A21 TaxID=3457318 RepID=UPI003FD590D5